MKPFLLSIHLFRRDLRLEDNTALIAALNQSEQVIPLFILDDDSSVSSCFGVNSFRFMLNSLIELNGELLKRGSQLYLFRGVAEEVIGRLISQHSIDAIFLNRDYTPASLLRESAIGLKCMQHQVSFQKYADALLVEPELVHKDDGTPYTVFTPFMKRAKRVAVSRPISNPFKNYYSLRLNNMLGVEQIQSLIPTELPLKLLSGGREEGLDLLAKVHCLDDYNTIRNNPSVKGTSLLSAHHQWGTISIRESYEVAQSFDQEHAFVNELYWRDFFTHIGFHFPRVFGNAFREKYNAIPWSVSEEQFQCWCTGQTGFPIVDAGMRELVQTGYMHNRVRMIVASFLVKDLHQDWRLGEHFFAQHLVDFDQAINNGNWQWAASTGCDAQPYFRIFNPWNQQEKYDRECVYVKRWIPELIHFSPETIHHLWKKFPTHIHYPRPIVDHSEVSKQAIRLFKQVTD